jgi:hypothetical protein
LNHKNLKGKRDKNKKLTWKWSGSEIGCERREKRKCECRDETDVWYATQASRSGFKDRVEGKLSYYRLGNLIKLGLNQLNGLNAMKHGLKHEKFSSHPYI